MKFEYREPTSDLLTRIDIHKRYGGRDIEQWMLQLLAPSERSKILDVGCGTGKQCFSFYRFLNSQCEIIGGDVSLELLEKAREEAAGQGADIQFRELDFNKTFPFKDEQFDLVTCSFAIYYAENIPFTIAEMRRVLKPDGRLFTTGPLPDNKKVFYEIIKEATGQPIPPMPGSSRYATEIFPEIRRQFTTADLHRFENPLLFQTPGPFLDYVRASLSEDRMLWKNLFQGEDDFQSVMKKISETVHQRMQSENSLVMTKVVGGIVAIK